MYAKLLKSEILKSRRTLAVTGALAFPAFVSIVALLIFYFKSDEFVKLGSNMWMLLGQIVFNSFGMLLLPMLTMIVCYSVNHIEYAADAWKNLFALPIRKHSIYLSKITFALLLLFSSLLLLCGFTFLVGYLLSIIKPELGFQDYNSNSFLIIFFLKFFYSALGLFGVQFVISIYWSDFIKPIGIGMTATVLGIMIAGSKYAYLFPYSLPLRITQQFYKEDINFFTKELGGSVASCLIFLVLGYFLILKKNLK